MQRCRRYAQDDHTHANNWLPPSVGLSPHSRVVLEIVEDRKQKEDGHNYEVVSQDNAQQDPRRLRYRCERRLGHLRGGPADVEQAHRNQNRARIHSLWRFRHRFLAAGRLQQELSNLLQWPEVLQGAGMWGGGVAQEKKGGEECEGRGL